jgi:hypothetical protein
MWRWLSNFLREIGAQMLVEFCIESTKGSCNNIPPLPPTTNQQDLSPQLLVYRGRSEGRSTTHEKLKASVLFKKPVPRLYRGNTWAIDPRKRRRAYPQPTGGPGLPWIFKKSCPRSQRIQWPTTTVASPQHNGTVGTQNNTHCWVASSCSRVPTG